MYVEAGNSIVVPSYASPAMKPAINMSMFGVFASFFFTEGLRSLLGEMRSPIKAVKCDTRSVQDMRDERKL